MLGKQAAANVGVIRAIGYSHQGQRRQPMLRRHHEFETGGFETLIQVPGRIRMRAQADERHLNAFGGVHGGYAATVLDTALGLTIFVSIDEAARHSTVDLAVKIVRPIPVGQPLEVETALVNVSRSVGVSQGELRGADGRVYAHGTTTCHIKR